MTNRVGSGSGFVCAALLGVLAMTSCSSSSTTGSKSTATPSFSPGGGAYNTSQTVTISDSTPGAVLYCTTDGTTPTTSSPSCAQPTTVYKSEFLQAIAVAPGKNPSAVASAGYTINLTAAATPTLSPGGGTYASAQSVIISDASSGANIYYTTDGSVPSASSTLYTGPVTVSTSETLNAIAVASGFSDSGVASAAYTINSVAPPAFSIASGTYSSAQTVSITDTTPNATIYYVINGTSPSASSTTYSGPITVSQSEIISAIAILGGNSSAVTTAAYAIQSASSVPAPTFTPAGGATVPVGQVVNIADGDANASIYYTTDGSVPSSSSTLYNASMGITLSSAGMVTIQAIAIDSGVSSAVASATYTVSSSAIPAPTFTPPSGATIASGGTVSIADTDSSAVIYYTTNGTTPSSSSTQYTAPITLSTGGKVTIEAVAIAGGTSSSVATASYTVGGSASPINGKVISGTKPVSGAMVQLYAAGSAGYGSTATALGSPVTTDSTGAFSVTGYACPASPGDLTYLVATGGNTGSGSNSALELMTALGPCGALSSSASVVINEVTAVVSAYALAQFTTSAPNVGAPSSSTNPTGSLAYQGLANAFATVNNLVDISKGTALSITPAYAANPVPYLNTSTAPQARVNTLANILNGCVDSSGSGSGCSSLFSAATPPSTGSSAPTNTLQAALNIAQNPGTNVATLFGLASSGAFTPVLSSAPNDWTLALTFTGGGLGISPTTSGNDSAGDTGIGPIFSTSLAIDAAGNVWVAGFAEKGYPTYSAGTSQLLPILAEFNNLGAPQSPATTVSSASVVAFGGYTLGSGSAGLGLSSIAIDQNGNLWLGDLSSAGNLYTLSPNPSVLASTVAGTSVYAVAIDPSGNAWTGQATNHLAEFQYSATSQSLTQLLTNPGTTTYGELTDLAFDTNGNLWASDYLNSTVYQIASDGSIAYNAFPTPGTLQSISLAADNNANIYGCGDAAGNILDVFNSGAITRTHTLGSRGCGEQLLLDGLGHFFAISNGLGYPPATAIDAYTSAGVAISPANGYTGTSGGEPATITVDSNLGSGVGYYPTTAAIDGSGNLWLVNIDTNNSGSTSGGPATGNVLVEFVGIAAPVVTPTSVAVTNGQSGTRP